MVAPILVVFDLDDTLYLERDFALSGFAAADAWLCRARSVKGLAPVCRALFFAGERLRVFDRALEMLGLRADPALVASLVSVYRSHAPDIRLADDAARYLASRSPAFPSAMITDGPTAMQRAKVHALGLGEALECIVCTGALGKGFGKPHPRAFAMVERWAAPTRLPLVYVADNPVKDFVTPRVRGWWTVQIARRERVHRLPAPGAAYEAHARVTTLDALDDCLIRLQRGAEDARPAASVDP
ncbi:HAD family hydrolase [Nitratireductor sp. GCM10026969]|uniref:HAD family hydrolase n=1 Tax=Nitratireductor sp. GCM10026969 TaxID=3252645 RepID=UPI0036186A7E